MLADWIHILKWIYIFHYWSFFTQILGSVDLQLFVFTNLSDGLVWLIFVSACDIDYLFAYVDKQLTLHQFFMIQVFIADSSHLNKNSGRWDLLF
jgi:hypothetical protein